MKKNIGLSFLFFVGFVGLVCSAESTLIEITDAVKVKDCSPLGSGFKRNNLLKKILSENFEGYVSRDTYSGELFEDGFMEYHKKNIPEERLAIFRKFFVGARACVVSGPAKGQWVNIKSVEVRQGQFTDKRGKKQDNQLAFFVFEKPLALDESLRTEAVNSFAGNGLLIEVSDPSMGTLGRGVHSKISDEFYAFEHQDLPPHSKGKTALLLKAADSSDPKVIKKTKNKLHLGHGLQSMKDTNCNRIYRVSFWAKALKEGAKVELTSERFFKHKDAKASPREMVALSSEWKKYDVDVDFTGCFPGPGIEGAPLGMQQIRMEMRAFDGDILLDDIEIEGLGYKNPTRWVDEAVEALRFANLGIIRRIGTHRPSVTMSFKPLLEQLAYTRFVPTKPTQKMSVDPITPGCYFELAEYLGVDAYYCLPTATTLDEMDAFMEYLGAPADVGYGKVRAAQGHPKPWLETLSGIHIEIGNELWNFGGYNGLDCWDALFVRAKESPYYRSNLTLHAAGMNFNKSMNTRIIEDTPSADCFSIAPYIGHKYPKNVWNYSPEDRARWVVDYGFEQNLGERAMAQYEYAKSKGIEYSIYEVNHHLTSIDGDKLGSMRRSVGPKSIALLNEFLVSKISGVNVVNNMLLMLRDAGIRNQCFFNFTGNFYGISVWGGVLSTSLENPRYRPHWLALSMVNAGMFGDLMETTHSGAMPTFLAPDMKNVEKPSYFLSDKAERENKEEVATKKKRKSSKKSKAPISRNCLWSYSFKKGNQRSLILANVDVLESFPVTIQFKGIPAGKVISKQLIGESHLSNNELDQDEQVFIEENELNGFKSGHKMMLPPASITTIIWTEK